jgi:Meiotically up-regulated gene 113
MIARGPDDGQPGDHVGSRRRPRSPPLGFSIPGCEACRPRGSFGEHVYKIGMTRRLDPLERIQELGDASVPFEFDVHAVLFAEDAPALEADLHRAFASRRVNRVNERKEFFKVSIDEIAAEVRKHRAEIMITMAAEAEDYRKTLAVIAELERSAVSAVENGASLTT